MYEIKCDLLNLRNTTALYMVTAEMNELHVHNSLE